MPNYHGRYTCSGDLQQRIVDFITRNADKYIIAREQATREHLQCYIEYKNTKKTWDNLFRTKFMEMHRNDKYFKEDKGTTIFYVCKEKDILAKRGFSDDDIEKFHSEYHQKNQQQQISLNIEEILISPPETKQEKVKKPKPLTFMRQCRNELLEEFPDLDFQAKHKPLVFMKVMSNLGEQCKNLDKFIIIRMVNGVLNSLIKNRKKWHEYWYQECFGETLYGKNGLIQIPDDDDDIIDESDDAFKAYMQSIKEENERIERETIERAKFHFFNKKIPDGG